MTLIEVLKAIDAASTARRVGTDALTPTFAKLLPLAFPNARIVDGESAMREARRVKTAEEIAAMSTALRAAEDGVAAAVDQLQPDLPEKTIAGAVLEAMAVAGVSTPATQDAAWVTSREHPWRRAGGDGRLQAGDLVALAAGALADGYVAEVGRTWPVGTADDKSVRRLYQRSNTLWERLLHACRPGAPVSALLAAYEAAGEPVPAMPVAHGLGMGFDPPVVSPLLADATDRERFEPGMVLAVTGYVWQQGVGAVFNRDVVALTEAGPQVLTTSPSWDQVVAAPQG